MRSPTTLRRDLLLPLILLIHQHPLSILAAPTPIPVPAPAPGLVDDLLNNANNLVQSITTAGQAAVDAVNAALAAQAGAPQPAATGVTGSGPEASGVASISVSVDVDTDNLLGAVAGSCFGPGNRQCWAPGFDINTDYESKTPPGTTRKVSLVVVICERGG